MKKYLFTLVVLLTLALSVAVVADAASFSTDKTEYTVGETINVSYENLDDGMKLMLYCENNLPGGYEAAIKETDSLSGSGSAEMYIPYNLFEGSYTVFLADADGNTVGTQRIKVCYEETQRTMTVDKTTVTAGDTITVTYENAESKDWFALYKKGQRPGSGQYYYIGKYYYTSGSSGSIDFEVSERFNDGTKLESGKYILALLKTDGYSPACSVEIDVEAKYSADEKQFTVDRNSYFPGDIMTIEYKNATAKDWIALYPESVKPGSGPASLTWTYVTGDGSTRLSVPSGVAAGNYIVYMLENDGYAILARASIVVTAKASGTPTAPVSVAYERDENALAGFADGVLSAVPGSMVTDGVVFFWGDENGVLADYTFIGYAPYDGYNGIYSYEITKSNMIPDGASKIYAFGINGSKQNYLEGKSTMSEGSVSCDVNAEAFKPTGLLYTFDVISDLHVNDGYGYPTFGENLTNNDRTALAFKDITENNPDTKGVMVVGDLVNYGAPAEYEMLGRMIEEFIPDKNMYYTVGNHEFYYDGDTAEPQSSENEHFAENWQRFRDFAGWDDGVFYKYMIMDGDYFIFMGTEDRSAENVPDTAYGYYSEEQREWLRGLLAEAKEIGANAFIFLHQSIDETVSGSYAWQNWDGVNDDELLRAVVESYENAFLFTGHSHWNLSSYMPFINGGTDGANYFNTASAGYLWSDANAAVPGSEGLRLEVYENYVLVRGRDFVNGKWVSNVQTIVRTDDNPISARKENGVVTVTKNPYADESFTVIAAVCENGRLVRTEIIGDEEFIGYEASFAVSEYQTAKVFAVESIESLMPVCEAIEVK